MVASASKPFVYTAKLMARRQAVINDYEQEIEALYDAAEESTQAAGTLPTSWTMETSLEFIRSVIHSVMKVEVPDDVDIFQHSCDRFVSDVKPALPCLMPCLFTVCRRLGYEIRSFMP